MALRQAGETRLPHLQPPSSPEVEPTAAPTPRALELAADFDNLANIERIQDQHRRELSRRQQRLTADQQTCDALEAHLAQRLDALLRTGALLERVAGGLAAAPGMDGPR